MRCKDVERLNSAYIDDELDQAQAAALRGHLGQCAACRRSVSELATMVDVAAQLPALEPPPSMWGAIERELARPEPAPSIRRRLWQRVASLAAWPPRTRAVSMRVPVPVPMPVIVLGLAAAAVIGVWGVGWLASSDPAATAPGESLAGEAPANSSAALHDPLAFERVPDLDATFLGRRASRVLATDQRYADTIRELRDLVAEDRADWPAEVSHAFDRRLYAFDAAAERHRQSLASVATHDVGARDALYDVYHAEIAFLQRAALDGPPELGAQP
jgi:anti-sigma factor RsiW